jgi:hypothetical protein
LAARGHQFVEFQRLETLKRQIVPDSEVSDPLITDPIRAVETLDYRTEHGRDSLALRLNRPINPRWEACFRLRATSYSGLFSSALVKFDRDIAYLYVDEYHAQQAVAFFKQYCQAANEEYAVQVKREHQETLKLERAELATRVAEQERKTRIRGKIQL